MGGLLMPFSRFNASNRSMARSRRRTADAILDIFADTLAEDRLSARMSNLKHSLAALTAFSAPSTRATKAFGFRLLATSRW